MSGYGGTVHLPFLPVIVVHRVVVSAAIVPYRHRAGLPPDTAAESLADLLTPREREVLQLVAEGHTNNAIADLLSISAKTVEKHRANLMSKLEVNDLASLIREGIKLGLILLD